MTNSVPPGRPGISPTWTSSAKTGAGTSAGTNSRVWFTISHGILDEVYFPFIDQPNTRDLGLLITDGSRFFSEEKRDTESTTTPIAPGVPGYLLTNTCKEGRYRLHKTVIADPRRDVVLQHIRFEALQGAMQDYHVYALLAPHLQNQGFGNRGWTGRHKGMPMLFAQRNSTALALACSTSFSAMSCGYVGFSDGWQDISTHNRMTWFFDEALDGNIALTGEISLPSNGEFTLALGFGRDGSEAGQQALSSLIQPFEDAVEMYVEDWQHYQMKLEPLDKSSNGINYYRVSTALLKACESKDIPGGIIASPSIPWGFAKGDNDLGGYHLVWTRDQVEGAGALLASGDLEGAYQVLVYLLSTQEPDGHWPQNMWLEGTPYWTGIQMDETAFPILLADALRRAGGLHKLDVWPAVRRAATYLVCNGPVTPEDRWEEDAGYSPFTLAVEIAALLAAADFADESGESGTAAYLRETADIWNGNIERWTYVNDSSLCRQHGVDGYYVRIGSADVADAASPYLGFVPIKNRTPDQSSERAANVVSPDALALVRFGLRAADDPRILNTVRLIDATLKSDTKTGPVWHRYNEDGYGEHSDGSPFDGTGTGRGWPLLAGERAHYEIARGDMTAAERLLHVLEAQTSPGGFLPEQVWDAEDMPQLELFNGKPSGSAMPLMWAHAEYIKLLRSLRDGRVFDMPPQTAQRYLIDKKTVKYVVWRFNQKSTSVPAGFTLRIELLTPATVVWTSSVWTTQKENLTIPTNVGVCFVDIPTTGLAPGTKLEFTLRWANGEWEGHNFDVQVL
ncbi:MAG TPA: glucan 1,4-alpha-glucosidase [Terriglobia bacterium]